MSCSCSGLPLYLFHLASGIYPAYHSHIFTDNFSGNDSITSLHITTLWSDFIKTGNPGGVWNPVDSDNKMFLNLNKEPRMEARDSRYDDKMVFWRSIGY